jgi:hypothetical protein
MAHWPNLSEALPQLATPREVGEQLDLTAETVSRLCAAGQLLGVKVGGRWHVHVGKLRELLDTTSLKGE